MDGDWVKKAEVIDRVVYDDGWSVQVDLEEFESGRRRICIYVYPDQEESYPWEQEAGSIDEAMQQMYQFFKKLHDEYEGEDDATP